MSILLYCLSYFIIGFLFVKLVKLDTSFQLTPRFATWLLVTWPFWLVFITVYWSGVGLNYLFTAIGKRL